MPHSAKPQRKRKHRPALPRGFHLYSLKMQLAWLNSNGYEEEAQQIKAELQKQSRQVPA